MKQIDFTVLRWAALFEGTSLLILLLIAMPLKYYAQLPIAVSIIGPIHGILFLAFITILCLHTVKRELSPILAILGFISAFIPFASFIFKAKALSPNNP